MCQVCQTLGQEVAVAYVYLDNGGVIDESQIATTEHGVRTAGCVVANATLARVQFIVDDGHFQKCRVTTNGQTKEDRLSGRQQENKQKHSEKTKEDISLEKQNEERRKERK